MAVKIPLVLTAGSVEQLQSGDSIAINDPNWALLQDPTGFNFPENVIVSYDSSTRKITLTGTFVAYWQGTVVAILTTGWVSEAHADVVGTYYLRYNGSSFVFDTNPWDFYDLQIAFAHYGSTDKFGLRECHSFQEWRSHEILHETIGTYRESGGTLAGYTIGSTTAAERRPSVSECTIQDEDLITVNAQIADNGPYTQMFLSGAGTTDFAIDAADVIPLSTNNPYYNPFGATWGQTLMPANSVATVWLIAIQAAADATSQKYRFAWIQPQWITQAAGSSAGQLTTARNSEALRSPSEVNLGDFGTKIPEYVFLARVMVQYTGGNWTIQAVTNILGNKFTQIGQPSGAYISSLSGEVTAGVDGVATVAQPVLAAVKAPVAGDAGKFFMATGADAGSYNDVWQQTIPTPANASAEGIILSMTAGESLAFPNTVYLKSDGRVWKADNALDTTMPCIGMALETKTAGQTIKILKKGVVRYDSWSWTPGNGIANLLFTGTAGALTQTSPAARIQVLGHLISATQIYFHPDWEILPSVFNASNASLAHGNSLTINFPAGITPLNIRSIYKDSLNNIRNTNDFSKGYRLVQPSTIFYTGTAIAVISSYDQNRTHACVCENGNVAIVHYNASGNLKFTLINGTTYAIISEGALVVSTSATTSYFRCKAIPTTNYFVISWADSTASQQGKFAIYSAVDGSKISTLETLLIDVSPATAWAAGDVITGQSSGKTCTIIMQLSATMYLVKDRSRAYTLGEIIGVTGTAAKLADQGASYPTFNANGTFAQTCTYNSVTTLSDGRIVIVWRDSGNLMKYVIFDKTGTLVEAVTTIHNQSLSNCIDVTTLTNNFWVVVCAAGAGADDGVFYVYDSSTNPSTQRVAQTIYSLNIYGYDVVNRVAPLPNAGFFLYFHDNAYSAYEVVSRWQYVSDTSWVSAGLMRPFSFSGTDNYQGMIDSRPSDNLSGIVNLSSAQMNGDYMVNVVICEGEEMTMTSKRDTMTPLPYGSGPATNGAKGILFLPNKRVMVYYTDVDDSSKGKFIVLQQTHFEVIENATSVVLTNYTGATQNVRMLVQI